MSGITDKEDLIINGISAGMDLEDMFIIAGCTAKQISELKTDDFFMSRVRSTGKVLEYDLLKNMHNIIGIQTEKGKDHGTIWLLSKLNPRYSDHPDQGDKAGIININMGSTPLSQMDTVEISGVEKVVVGAGSKILNTNLHSPDATDIDTMREKY